MLSSDTLLAVAPYCYINHLYIDAWHHSHFTMISQAAQLFAEAIHQDYQHHPDLNEYRVFTGFDNGLWILGVAVELPASINTSCSALTVSERRIEKHHCKCNIALIVANEIERMPFTISVRHYELMGC